MRRKDREITDFNRLLEILNACDCARLGLTDGDECYIVPMNFGFVSEKTGNLKLYFHSAAEGRKIDLIKKSATAAFEADTAHELVRGKNACDCTFLYQSVMGTGNIRLLTDTKEKAAALAVIMKHYDSGFNGTFPSHALDGVALAELSVKKWSCKENGRK